MVDGGGGDGGGCSLTLPSVRGKSRLASRVQTVYLISKNLFGGIRERRCAGERGVGRGRVDEREWHQRTCA